MQLEQVAGDVLLQQQSRCTQHREPPILKLLGLHGDLVGVLGLEVERVEAEVGHRAELEQVEGLNGCYGEEDLVDSFGSLSEEFSGRLISLLAVENRVGEGSKEVLVEQPRRCKHANAAVL